MLGGGSSLNMGRRRRLGQMATANWPESGGRRSSGVGGGGWWFSMLARLSKEALVPCCVERRELDSLERSITHIYCELNEIGFI